MLNFIIMNGLPYSYDVETGKAYKCRFDDKGFTAGAEVKVTNAPVEIFSELSIQAQCANLDSIKDNEEVKPKARKAKAKE